MAVNVSARCMKCKGQVDLVSNPQTQEPAGIVQTGKNRLMLVGWCPTCGTKACRFLSKTKDAELIEKFGVAVVHEVKENKEAPDVVGLEETGKKAGRKVKQDMLEDLPEEMLEETPPKKSAKKKVGAVKGKKDTIYAKPPKKQVSAAYPINIFKEYKEKMLKAVMKAPDLIKFGGEVYASPSMAATAATGGKSVNGWKFWLFKDKDGNPRPINDLRDQSNVAKLGPKKKTDEVKAATETKKEYPPIVLPAACKLPRKNGPKASAAVYVDPKTARHGRFFGYLFADGVLLRIPYNKKGEGDKAGIKKLGKFENWKEAQVKVQANAKKDGLVAVKYS
jgi:hypothetical protein